MSPEKRKIIHEEKIVVGGKKKSPLRGVLSSALSSASTGVKQAAHSATTAAQTNPTITEAKDTASEPQHKDNRPAIVFVVTQALWEERQKYVARLAEHYAADYKIHLIFGTFEFTGKNVLREKIESLGGTAHPVDALTSRNVLANEIGSIFAIRKILSQVKPKVVHAQDGKATMLSGLAMMTGVRGRLVTTLHSLMDFTAIKKSEAPVVKFFTKLSYGMARKIIVRDQHTYNRAVKLWGKQKPELVLPAVGHIEFTNAQEKLRAIAQDAPSAFATHLNEQSTTIIGNIAPLDADQGLTFTLHAMNLLKERGHSVVYIHYGIGDQERLLEHEIAQFGLEDRVLLKGLDKMASAYLPVFDIVVHPTLQPGFPSMVREAALAKRPVVISTVEGVSESVADGTEALLVEPRSAQSIADAIERLIQDRSLMQSIGESLSQRIQRDYSAQAMIDKTSQIYGISS